MTKEWVIHYELTYGVIIGMETQRQHSATHCSIIVAQNEDHVEGMAEKKYKGAPFGSQAARFDVSAVHPANKRVGTFTQIPYCKKMTSGQERNLGPGKYNPDMSDFGPRMLKERSKGPGWKRALETSREAQIPGQLYREAWENKHLLKTKVGPGTYKLTDFIEELSKKPHSIRGVCESREERFKETRCWTPGPGTYMGIGISRVCEEKNRTKSAGSKPRVGFGSTIQRFTPDKMEETGPSPGTYDLKSSTDLLLNSNTGKRGPYDLFTGPRDKPICYGYLAVPKKAGVNPGEYIREMPRFGEDLEKPDKRRHGVFSTLERYPDVKTNQRLNKNNSQPKRPTSGPPVGWYDLIPVREPGRQTAPPFLSSCKRFDKRTQRKQIGEYSPVGPGNYTITEQNQKISGHQSNFNSVTKRYLHSLNRDKYIQERLRPMNVSVARAVFSA